MKHIILLMSALIVLWNSSATFSQSRPSGPTRRKAEPTYGQLVGAGYEFVKEGKPKEAYAAAMMAARKEPKRFESYALAAAVLHVQGADRDARVLVRKALTLAPTNKKPPLRELAARIDHAVSAKPASSSIVAPARGGNRKASSTQPVNKGAKPSVSRPRLTVRIRPSSLGYVNVRREPNTGSTVVGRVSPGATYTASEVVNGWYRLEGEAGWVAGRYVVIE